MIKIMIRIKIVTGKSAEASEQGHSSLTIAVCRAVH